MKENINIADLAFKKLSFHCLRYPSSKVFGALVKNTKSKIITNAYPLFHTAIVAPSLSLGFDLVQSNIESDEEIAGFYEFCDDGVLALTRVIENNQQLKGMILVKVTCADKTLSLSSENSSINFPQFSLLDKDLVEGNHRLIVDLDAHLDDISLDFRNTYVK